MTVRLIGTTTEATNGLGSGYLIPCKFTALLTGIVKEIRMYSLANGNTKVAIYADSAGEPGALITANNTGQAVLANQWNVLTISPTPITKDTPYWLTAIADTTGSIARNNDPGVARYRSETYAGFTFPDPAGTGFGTDTKERCFAGWGDLPGWTGKISGVTNPAKIMGVPVANIAKVKGV